MAADTCVNSKHEWVIWIIYVSYLNNFLLLSSSQTKKTANADKVVAKAFIDYFNTNSKDPLPKDVAKVEIWVFKSNV